MNSKITQEQKIFYTIALFGGFLCGYSVLSRLEVLGSAQTSNLISLVFAISGQNLIEVLIRLGALLLYVIAIALTVIIKQYIKTDIRIISIILNFIGIIILCFIPQNVDEILGLYPVFFILAFQWNSFPGAKGYASSCIFSSNNLRQTVVSFTDYLCTNNVNSLKKFCFFAGSLLFYHIGVAISFIGYMVLHFKSVLIGLLPLFIAIIEIMIDKKKNKQYTQ